MRNSENGSRKRQKTASAASAAAPKYAYPRFEKNAPKSSAKPSTSRSLVGMKSAIANSPAADTKLTASAIDGNSRRRRPQKYSASAQAAIMTGSGISTMASFTRPMASSVPAPSKMAGRPKRFENRLNDRNDNPVMSTTMPMVRKMSLKLVRKRRFSGSSMRSGSLRAFRKASRRSAFSREMTPASTAARMSPLSNIEGLHDEIAVGVDADLGGDRHRLARDLFGVVFILIQRSRGGQRIVAP